MSVRRNCNDPNSDCRLYDECEYVHYGTGPRDFHRLCGLCRDDLAWQCNECDEWFYKEDMGKDVDHGCGVAQEDES